MNEYTSLQSPLAKAKNLGSAGHGSQHWMMQRLSAILMIPLFIWAFFFLYGISGPYKGNIMHFLRCPCNLLPCLMLLVVGIYHGTLGMQVVIEDYISCLCVRNALIIILKLCGFITIFSLAISLIYFFLHI
jgi:succinate dehydrogenase / fumarate reductase, membrane anchor subunit